MKINELSREDVFRTLVTSSQGLSGEEAGRRLAEFGPNAIRAARKHTLWLRFLGQFTHFLAVLLWIAAGLSFVSEFLSPGEGMLTLGIAIVGVIVINALFTFYQEYRAERALDALKKLLPYTVTIVRAGHEQEVPVEGVVPGDLVRLGEGNKVPADIRLIETQTLRTNNASLTGESEPVLRRTDSFPGDPITSPNIAFAGTEVVSGSGWGIVFATGMQTEIGRIAHLTGTVTPGLTPLQKQIIHVTRIIALIATVMGVLFFLLGQTLGMTFWQNILFALGIIAANVPEGLPPTVTLALAMGSQRMAKRHALIRTLTSVETLGSVTVICTDKTGTLTQNRMAVTSIWADGILHEPIARPAGDAHRLLLTTALLCNNARIENGEEHGDPTETALLRASRQALGGTTGKRLAEVPFDADRKMMSTVNTLPDGTFVLTKGALERVKPLCSRILDKGQAVPLDEARAEDITRAYHELMDMGLRVLAFACRPLDAAPSAGNDPEENLEQDMIFLGLAGLQDPPRPEVPSAIAKCREAGVRIIMITGDASRTALAIAKQIGLVRTGAVVVDGEEFTRLGDRELRERLAQQEVLFTRMTPKHKMRVVSILKEEGEVVAVTGDGVNDAPALKRADIGIAMGITGTDVAKEAADMVLLDDNFATIVNAVEEGRTIFENIRKFISYIMVHLMSEAVPYVLFSLFRIPLPITVMQILAIDLGTDTLPALALGAELPEGGIMRRPPRPRTEGLLSWRLLVRSYLFLGLISAAGAMFAYFYVLFMGGWTWGMQLPLDHPLTRQASTATFLGIVVMQVGNIFACRSFRESTFRPGFFTNKLIFIGIAFELLLAVFIIYHPWGHALFGTAPLPVTVWLALIPFAVFLLFAEELRKLVVRRTNPA